MKGTQLLTLLCKVAQLFIIFISAVTPKSNREQKTTEKSRFFSNPSKPLLNKCSITINPVQWNRKTRTSHTNAHTQLRAKKKTGEKAAVKMSLNTD